MSSSFVSSLVNNVGSKHNKQYGENGAVEYTKHGVIGNTSRDVEGYLVAAFAGILRGVSKEVVEDYVDSVFKSDDHRRRDLEDFVSMVFHSRECRGDGKGERLAFYYLVFALYKYVPKTTCELLKLVPEYGYWKDFQNLIQMSFNDYTDTVNMRNSIYTIWVEQLREDITTLTKDEVGNLSLASKYFPKEGRSLDKKYKVCEAMARLYFNDHQTLRDTILGRMRKEVLSPLTKKIGLIERLMSANEWDKIQFKLVPGRCLNMNRKAFLNLKKDNTTRHPEDEARNRCKLNLTNHLELAKEGKAKVHGKQMFLHELVGGFMKNWSYTSLLSEEKLLYQAQWEDHYRHYLEMVNNGSGLDKVMVLGDFSGSMSGVPMQVSAAVAIMISSLLPKPWKNKFISFDTTPQLLEIPDSDLSDKVQYVMNSPWGGSTDFLSAIELILKVGIDNKLNAVDMPEKLIIVSDMQFNQAANSGYKNLNTYSLMEHYTNSMYSRMANMKDQPTHNMIREAFAEAGRQVSGKPWKAPTMVYWNVRSSEGGFPVQSNTPNTQMLSGFSLSLLKLVLDNDDLGVPQQPTPYDTFLRAVRSEKYEKVRDVVRKVQEEPYFSEELVEEV